MNTKWYEFIAEKIHPAELVVLIKKLMRIKRRYFSLDNLKLYIDPVSHFGLRIIRDKEYEPEVTTAIREILQENDVFIDLGGNEGFFSIIASRKVGSGGKVFCIEPQERLWQIILKNLINNRCSNIQLIPVAIGMENRDVELVLTPSINTGSSKINKHSRAFFWKRQKVPMFQLDAIIDLYKIGKIKLLKIDIEGYELFAMKSATNALKKGLISNIIIELHPEELKALNQSVEDVHNFLLEMGYDKSPNYPNVYSLKQDTNIRTHAFSNPDHAFS